jgi:hypothetical protein
MPQGTQRCSRTKMVLPLRVWSDERALDGMPGQWAHTIEISPIGCRLGGLRTELSAGQTITLQRGQHKASFRVIWSKHLAANENQAGIEALDYEKNIWGVDLPAAPVAQSPVSGNSPLRTGMATVTSIPKSSASAHKMTSKFFPMAAHLRVRWGLSIGLLLLSLALGLSLYHEIFYVSTQVEIQPLVPGPPTAEDLARLTPKPRALPVAINRPLDNSVSRLQVAEVPTGRVAYPVAPDDSLAGKVRLQIVIAADGLVKQIHVISGKQVLAEAAAQAIHLWHYRPFQGSDGVTERETSVVVSFRGTDAVSVEFPSANRNSEIRAN